VAHSKLDLNEDDDIKFEMGEIAHAAYALNTPKLAGADLHLFKGLLKDVFPQVESTSSVAVDDYKATLMGHLERALPEHRLCTSETFLEKCVQILECTQIRHGLMVLGPTFSGKTSAIRVLGSAINAMVADVQSTGAITGRSMYTMPLKLHFLNPKSMYIPELFGSFNPHSREWNDGILASILRGCVRDDAAHHWIVIDGPVDSLWVENMNSALDDNKKLCLTSGEQIEVTAPISILFEPDNLAYASPATVSELAQPSIFFFPHTLGGYCCRTQ
jgi:dynein heavy chain